MNPSTTIFWLSVISLKPSFLFLAASITSCTFIFYFSFTVFTSKPSACQRKDWPRSSVLKIDLTRKSISWLDIANDILGCHTASLKYSALQARKVRFLTDHLTSRNCKSSFEKVYLLAFQCLPITTDAVPCILCMYRDISSIKTSQKIMIFKDKKKRH